MKLHLDFLNLVLQIRFLIASLCRIWNGYVHDLLTLALASRSASASAAIALCNDKGNLTSFLNFFALLNKAIKIVQFNVRITKDHWYSYTSNKTALSKVTIAGKCISYMTEFQ